MKKLAFLILLLVGITFQSWSVEDTTPKSQIHLKTGEVVNGHITKRDDVKINFHSTDDNLDYIFLMNEVAYVTHDTVKKNYETNRFRGMVDIGYGMGIGSPRANMLVVETSFGYQFSHFIYIGGGIGVYNPSFVTNSFPFRQDLSADNQTRCTPEWNTPFVPIYANLRSQLYESDHFTPFADIKAGYSIFNHGGLFLSPSVGVHIPTKSMFSINFTVSYSLQQCKYKLWTTGNTPGAVPDGTGKSYLDTRLNLSNLALKVGVEF